MHWAHSEPLSVVQTQPGLIDTPDRQDRAGGEQDANALAPRKSGLPPVQEHKQLDGEVTVHMLQLICYLQHVPADRLVRWLLALK